jgi:2-polyprenyl-6-methoxyphenol hydroxylase-like FAD-dependent oxidoreductase
MEKDMYQKMLRKTDRLGDHVIVVGGSLAGLLATRVLADYYNKVTLIERDRLPDEPDNRKGVPQGRHAHGLLAKGREILSQLFPNLMDDLVEGGAVLVDIAGDMSWYHFGGYKVRCKSGIVGPILSRPFLEWHLRRRVLALKNVTSIQEHDVKGLVATAGGARITGVTITPHGRSSGEEVLLADLVVDASGRGSQSPKWLEALGYRRPDELSITMNAGYTSRMYRRRPEDMEEAKTYFILPEPPHQTRLGAAFAVEGDRWHISLGGWLNDHAPADEAGFLEFARSLPSPHIYQIMQRAEPLTDFAVHKFPSNQRRLYEKMRRFPEGYLVIGDAVCSFNPIYGQGMTVGALEAAALDGLLRERRERGRDVRGMWKPFFKRMSKIVDVAWMMSACEDVRYPQVTGSKPAGASLINWYMGKLHRAATHDAAVCVAFFQMMNLLRPPSLAFRPDIVFRVLKNGFKKSAVRQPALRRPLRATE